MTKAETAMKTMDQENRNSAASFRIVLLMGLFVVQNSCAAILGRYVRTASDEKFDIAHMLIVVELVKLCLSLVLESQLFSSPVQALHHLTQSLEQHLWQRPLDAIKLLLPASLYFGQNFLQIQALGSVPVHMYQITIHSKVILLAIFSSLFLGRSYKCLQWLAVLGLSMGISFVTLFGTTNNNNKKISGQSTTSMTNEAVSGLGVLWMANICSSTAAIYFEKVIKKTETEREIKPPSLWMRNIQLSLFSLPFCYFSKLLQQSSSDKPFFHGFTIWVYVQAVVFGAGGLLVAALVRSTSTVHKSFAAGASVVLTTGLSVALFGTVLTPVFLVGSILILASIVAFAKGGGDDMTSLSTLSCCCSCCWDPLSEFWIVPPNQKDRSANGGVEADSWWKGKGRRLLRLLAAIAACFFLGLNMFRESWDVMRAGSVVSHQRIVHSVVDDLLQTPAVLSFNNTNNDEKQVEFIPHYTTEDDISNRSLRFPNVEQRVQLYMTDWYENCDIKLFYSFDTTEQAAIFSYNHKLDSALVQQHRNRTRKTPLQQMDHVSLGMQMGWDIPFAVAQRMNLDAKQISFVCERENFPTHHCEDVDEDFVKFATYHSPNSAITESKQKTGWFRFPDPPIILQYGDRTYWRKKRVGINVPMFRQIRKSLSRKEIQDRANGRFCSPESRVLVSALKGDDGHSISYNSQMTMSIIWKLQARRHYGVHLTKIPRADISWSLKKNTAVWRGALTGLFEEDAKRSENPREACRVFPRCRLVFDYYNSTLVDASLTGWYHFESLIPKEIDGRLLIQKERKKEENMLSHKFIIILEGNGVSTALKWALYSKSCVFMPVPSFTSWAMEELLKPWVHYVPLDDDLQNVEERVRWALENDDRAQQIGERGSLWVHDLLFHADAEKDEREIKIELLRRSKVHFQKASED